MFLHVSVCPQGWSTWAGTPLRQVHPQAGTPPTPPRAGTPPGRYTHSTPPRAGAPPREVHPPGRYTPLGRYTPQAGTPHWASTPPRQVHPPRQVYPPLPQCMLGYGQQASGTHPTGIRRFKCPPKQQNRRRNGILFKMPSFVSTPDSFFPANWPPLQEASQLFPVRVLYYIILVNCNITK